MAVPTIHLNGTSQRALVDQLLDARKWFPLTEILASMKNARNTWVEDTQMFQRIAGVKVTPRAELEAEWETLTSRGRHRAVDNIKDHRIIQDAAIRAGKNRKS